MWLQLYGLQDFGWLWWVSSRTQFNFYIFGSILLWKTQYNDQLSKRSSLVLVTLTRPWEWGSAGVKYKSRNVLTDQELREGIKTFRYWGILDANWLIFVSQRVDPMHLPKTHLEVYLYEFTLQLPSLIGAWVDEHFFL